MNINSSMDDGPNPPFPYFPDAKFSDFPYGPGPGGGPGQGFHEFFPGQPPHFPPGGVPLDPSLGDFGGPPPDGQGPPNSGGGPGGGPGGGGPPGPPPPGAFMTQAELMNQHRGSPDYMPPGKLKMVGGVCPTAWPESSDLF